ncbi:SapC family protein [Paraglaciecola sp. L3A3]|uniref:SapC family protein n=1 Tax=Paraglaciecola sp. L3A3 TaxID=2686358 RepID=UPI00131BB93D|nr:SapC family protein [Paraglaciecola sp. L3A3]
MANNELLTNLSHQDLRVMTHYSATFGENVGSVLAFPSEFSELQKEYPILFRKNSDTDKFQATVLLGLSQDENLFLNPDVKSGWAAHYVPAVIAKGPFLIGLRTDETQNSPPVIHIDLEHPKVSKKEGYPLFLEHGGNSPYLEHVSSILKIIHQGISIQDHMFKLFSELDLIEPVNIEINLNNEQKQKLVGNYTINENKLIALDGEQLETLNKFGFLAMAYAVVASMSNIRKLTQIKNTMSK